MMQFQVPRGELRSALGRLLPHAGGSAEKNESGPFGRIRFSLDAHDLLVMWTGDNRTRAMATAPITAFKAPEIGQFDLDAAEVAAVLSTLKPVGSAEARAAWMKADYLITVDEEKVTFAEHWAIFPTTKELTVPRIKYQQEDPYPDIPAAILSAAYAPQAPIESYSAQQSVIARVTKSAFDSVQFIGIQRQALLVGGTPLFTAVIPCDVQLGHRRPGFVEMDLTALQVVLQRHVRAPRLATDRDSQVLKQRLGWEQGFEAAIRPVDKSKRISSLTVVKSDA